MQYHLSRVWLDKNTQSAEIRVDIEFTGGQLLRFTNSGVEYLAEPVNLPETQQVIAALQQVAQTYRFSTDDEHITTLSQRATYAVYVYIDSHLCVIEDFLNSPGAYRE